MKKITKKAIFAFLVTIPFMFNCLVYAATNSCKMTPEEFLAIYDDWAATKPTTAQMLDNQWQNVDLTNELTRQSTNVVEHDDYYDIFAAVYVTGKFANVVPFSEEALSLIPTSLKDDYMSVSDDGFTDEYKEKTAGKTYKELALNAIVSAWSGYYRGKPVKVRLMDISSENPDKFYRLHGNYVYIKIDMPTNGYDNYYAWQRWHLTKPHAKIHLPIGTYNVGWLIGNNNVVTKSEGTDFSSIETFMGESAHEFGHTIGLADAYLEDSKFLEYSTDTFSIMLSSAYSPACPFDYHMFLDHKFREGSENITRRKYFNDYVIKQTYKAIYDKCNKEQ